MKKFFKRLALLLLIIAAGLGAFVAFAYWKSRGRMGKTYTVQGHVIAVPTDAAAIAEGKRLFASRGCVDCHSSDLAGKVFLENPAIGTFSGTNLTRGKGGVANKMTALDFEKALRHGVGRGGKPLIFMPSTDFSGMSDEDVGRLFAYIQSAAPVDKPSARQKIGPLGRILYITGKMPLLVTAEHIDHNAASTAKIAPAINVEYGKYIAQTCTGCHGANLAGGPIPGAPPEWPAAQDIRKSAMAKWNEQQFIAAIRTGRRPDGSEIRFPMPWKNFALMTDTELKALWLFLRS
jgi:mono/diheme cytochrome c family protein